MDNNKNSIFRKESLERLSTPEQLDQLMEVIDTKDWLPLAALGSLILLALLWSILGRIPITVTGRGVLIRQAENSSSPLVGASYFSIGDGKRIQPGMKMAIIPDTVQKEQFGGIVSTVTSVSDFPVTPQEATGLIKHSQVAESLLSQAGTMQVVAQLEPDSSTFSGYRWSSSKGPRLKISPGTTTTVRVTLQEKAPITFVLPFLEVAQ